MRERADWRELIVAAAGAVVLSAMVVGSVLTAPRLQAQSPGGQAPATPTPAAQAQTAQWEIAAGGKMAFDVASVKRDLADQRLSNVSTNIPLGPGDYYAPTGGLFAVTNIQLFNFITFAYKATSNQSEILRAQVPGWVQFNRYDIEARAEGNPTKDQMRLMMQALLADRFKLAMHRETRELPVFGLALDKPGKMGPQLQAHPGSTTCSTGPVPAGASDSVAGGFPTTCGGVQPMTPSVPGRFRIGGRNVPLALLASTLPGMPDGPDRPVLNQTGLSGTFDFTIEWAPMPDGSSPAGAGVPADEAGPTFLQALREQLGLKLESATGPVDVLVVDHIEEPSEN